MTQNMERKVRTRDEQIIELTESVKDFDDYDGNREVSLRHIVEAEARGAAAASGNVAALEARVKELEEVLKKISTISSCHAPRKRQNVYLNENKRIRWVSDTARDLARAALVREGGPA